MQCKYLYLATICRLRLDFWIFIQQPDVATADNRYSSDTVVKRLKRQQPRASSCMHQQHGRIVELHSCCDETLLLALALLLLLLLLTGMAVGTAMVVAVPVAGGCCDVSA